MQRILSLQRLGLTDVGGVGDTTSTCSYAFCQGCSSNSAIGCGGTIVTKPTT